MQDATIGQHEVDHLMASANDLGAQQSKISIENAILLGSQIAAVSVGAFEVRSAVPSRRDDDPHENGERRARVTS
jgi:hypothetical protein